jgi:cellulose synthase/poly-beta-1,6-N-acetylglucosamine synthase-like glycosyltransferase
LVIQIIFFILSLVLTLLFFLYGFNHYYLLLAARRYSTPDLPEPAGELPPVSIHLPIYNEKYVVRRLVAACAGMAEAYGKEKVNILILDDSDDDTMSEIDATAGEYIRKGCRIEVVRRGDRQGFKAGALQAGLERTPEDFIAIFDADFIPPADFLLRTMPHLMQDPKIGIIQSRWCHLNREYNFLTRAAAVAMDIHFLVEQAGRYASGSFQNFNGSGGVLQKKAMLEAGGWQADTLAEDLDLSYRVQLRGYRVLYLKDLQVPAEIPPTLPGFKKQQGRWACGSLRTARKILPRLLRQRELGFKKRLQAFIHLTAYILPSLMTISFVLNCITTIFNLNSGGSIQTDPLFQPQGILGFTRILAAFSTQKEVWTILGPLIVLCTIAPWVSSISTLRTEKRLLSRNLGSLLGLLLLGFGISLSNTLEAGKALFSNRIWEFTRTPKYADLANRGEWRARRYQTVLNPVWMLELLFACLGVYAMGCAIGRSNYFVLLILVPFTISYAFVSLLTVLQSRRQKAV